MRRALRWMTVMGIMLVAVLGLNNGAVEGRDVDIKGLMGENFGQIQKILINLITGNYQNVPHDVDLIKEHAIQLSKNVPASAEPNRELFLAIAFNLRVHAGNLSTIARTLMERDSETANGQLLKIDYLRNSAAAHFGRMVTSCVACHNQFRRGVVKVTR